MFVYVFVEYVYQKKIEHERNTNSSKLDCKTGVKHSHAYLGVLLSIGENLIEYGTRGKTAQIDNVV